MEEGKSAYKQGRRKKTTVSFHGGGIGGVVVLGGALAAAALIAFLANRRNKGRRPTKKDQSIDSDSSKNSTLKNKKNTDEESEGLQLLVHPSPPSVHLLNPCCKSNGTSEMGSAQIAPNELISTKNPILEEISVLEINGGKETLKNGEHDESFLSDVTNQRNISLCKDNGIGNEEYTLQVLEISSVLEEEVNKINDAGEEPPLLEVIEEVKREEEASEIVIVEQLDEDDVNKINDAGEEPPLLEAIEEAKKNEGASSEISIAEQVEENPPMKSVEEEDADLDDDDESEEEKSEDSSEETVDSSMESNAEAIWPTESIEKLSLALKKMNNNYQISGEKIGEEDGTVESTRNPMVISDNKETIKLLTVKDHPVKSGKLRMLILSILGTVLLLLMLGFFTHHEALFSYLVNGDSIL